MRYEIIIDKLDHETVNIEVKDNGKTIYTKYARTYEKEEMIGILTERIVDIIKEITSDW